MRPGQQPRTRLRPRRAGPHPRRAGPRRAAGLIHGHSCHHPRPAGACRGRLIRYGCGDAINDHEGTSGYPEFGDDLRLLSVAHAAAGTGTLAAPHMAPMQANKMRLYHAPAEDGTWLRAAPERISHRFGSQISLQPDGTVAQPPPASHHPPRPQHTMPAHRDHPTAAPAEMRAFDLRMFRRKPASSSSLGNSAESMRANAVTYLPRARSPNRNGRGCAGPRWWLRADHAVLNGNALAGDMAPQRPAGAGQRPGVRPVAGVG